MRNFISAVCVFISLTGYSKEEGKNAKSDGNLIKIQTARSDMRPWLNFNDAATRTTFNTAVHGQALYISSDLNITPGYIKKWKWIAKENKFRFLLDTSKKYHNGKAVTAYDFELVLVKPFISHLSRVNEKIPLSMIRGVDRLKEGMAFKSGILDGVKVINSETIDVYLTTGHTRFLYSLGELLPALAPIEEFNDDLYTFKKIPIGCGSYRVTFVDAQTSMVRVERVKSSKGPASIEFYSDKTAYDNRVDIALGGGVFNMKKVVKEHPDEYRQIMGPLPSSIQILVFNYQTEAAQNDQFREAVSYAFDRAQPFPDYPNKTPTGSIIPVLSYGHKQKPFKYDQVKAKSLFNSLPARIKEREHLLVAHGTPGTEPARYYKEVQNALLAIGMKVRLELSEETEIKKNDVTTTMVLFGRGVDSNPLMTFAYYRPGASFETLKADSNYEAIFKKAEESDSVDERAKYIESLSEIIYNKNIVLPYHQNYPAYYISRKVKSLGLDVSAWSLNVENIEMKNE